jgi:hypothetical protein
LRAGSGSGQSALAGHGGHRAVCELPIAGIHWSVSLSGRNGQVWSIQEVVGRAVLPFKVPPTAIGAHPRQICALGSV